MAKIDLFDQQWIDLVFEGKNEAYGAYKMRQNTNNRNLMAMLALIAGIAGIVLLLLAYGAAKDSILAAEKEKAEATEVNLLADEKEEEEVEEEEIIEFEEEILPEQEQVELEELVNSEKYTDFAMDDEKEKEVIKTAEEANEGTDVTATMDFSEGSDQGTKVMDEEKVIVEEKQDVEETKVHTIVEQMPSFPGGTGALTQFLQKNLRYPAIAEENGIQGRVTCQFTVERDGSITDVKVAKGVDPSLDREAIRVIKSMPKWIPGKQNGKNVRVRFTCPVTFKLQ